MSIVRKLVSNGANVECVDAWSHDGEFKKLAGSIEVILEEVSDTEFRFFENYRLTFKTKT